MPDWVQTVLNLLAPTAIGGVVYLFSQVQNTKTSLALHHTRLKTLESDNASGKGLVERVVKIETSLPFMSETLGRIDRAVSGLNDTVHRIEVSVGSGNKGSAV